MDVTGLDVDDGVSILKMFWATRRQRGCYQSVERERIKSAFNFASGKS